MTDYSKAIEFSKQIREFILSNITDGEEALQYVDIVLPYFLLYRFPTIFEKDNTRNKNTTLQIFIWKVREIIQLLRVKKYQVHPENTSSKDKIFLLGFSSNQYRDVLKNIEEKLKSEGRFETISLNADYKFDDNFKSVWGFKYKELDKDNIELVRHIEQIKKQVINADIVGYLNNEFQELSREIIAEEVTCLFDFEIKKHISQINIAENLLKSLKPKLIITTDDVDQRCRVYSVLGEKYGIKSMLVQQGLVSKNYPEWLFTKVDKIACFGRKSAEAITHQGYESTNIVITGNCGFDYINTLPVGSESISEALFLFASQPYYVNAFSSQEVRISMIKDLIDIFSENPHLKLLVKPHPHESVDLLQKLIRNCPNIKLCEKSQPISNLINTCDVLITMFSTVGFEAIYHNKPVINIIYENSTYPTIYEEYNATHIVKDKNELERVIYDLSTEHGIIEYETRNKDSRERFIYDNLFSADGLSGNRVMKVINSMISN
jgi:hypothetical protein